jgi:hypothetical protein
MDPTGTDTRRGVLLAHHQFGTAFEPGFQPGKVSHVVPILLSRLALRLH